MKLKEFEVLEIKSYIVHAFTEEQAMRKFGNYDYIEGDQWEKVRELGPVNMDATGPA